LEPYGFAKPMASAAKKSWFLHCY